MFVGRAAELRVLADLAGAACQGVPQTVFVAGEAGIGKTRLIGEALRTLAAGDAVTAVGECLRIGQDAVPFVPFRTALRHLDEQLPGAVLAAAGGQEHLLAPLLPEPGTTGADGYETGDTAQLFETIARVLERLASERLIVLVIEDLHWADAGTLQLLGYLMGTRRRGRLLIVASYRSDDLPGPHPLRSLLAEASRERDVRVVKLRRFRRVEVLRQLTGLLGDPPDPAVLEEVFSRSGGNAFFVEELARTHRDHGRVIVDELRDLLLIRVESLPENAQRVIRLVAEGGDVVTFPLLRAVAGINDDELVGVLRRAIDAEILTAAENGYAFRHALVREAVAGNLMPGERTLINQRYAEALESDPRLVPAQELAARLALYWYAADRPDKALHLNVVAAASAGNRYAHAEQLRLLERAIELWPRASGDAQRGLPPTGPIETYPDWPADADAPHAHQVDLRAAAAVAARRAGNPARARTLVSEGLDLLGPSPDPQRAAWFWTRASRLVQELNHGDGCAELSTADSLVGDDPPSEVRAEVLEQIALWGVKHRAREWSRTAVDRAIRYAVRVKRVDIELRARVTRCWLEADTDVDGRSVTELYELRRRAEELGAVEIIGRVSNNLPSILEGMGRSAEALIAAEHSVATCRSLGMADLEAWVHSNRALSLFHLGRWDESEAALEEGLALVRSAHGRGILTALQARGLLERGDPAAAAGRLALAQRHLAGADRQPQLDVPLVGFAMKIAAGQDRIDAARAAFREADAAGLTDGPVRYTLPMLCDAAAIEAANGPSAEMLNLIRAAAARQTALFPISQAFALMLSAYLSAAEQTDEPAQWAAVITAFEPLDRPYETAAAHAGRAHSLIRMRDRPGAAAEIDRARDIAAGIGAGLLLGDIEALARRIGTATAAADPTAADFGLTRREAEVLRLVAAGQSNRRIGRELFISDKTVSTHVTRVLAKLGAGSRTEAAALAHRFGLADR